MFPYKTKRLQTQTHTCIFLLRPQHSQISAMQAGRLKEHAWEHPLSAAQGSSCSGFSDEGATRRPLTSLEEKIKVCERPDRLGSATNPEMSELGLPGLESSMNDKLWNKWKQGMHLPKNDQTAVEKQAPQVCRVSTVPSPIITDQWLKFEQVTERRWVQLKPVHHQTTTTSTNTSKERRTSTWEYHVLLIRLCTTQIWLAESYSGLFFQTQMRIWCKYL